MAPVGCCFTLTAKIILCGYTHAAVTDRYLLACDLSSETLMLLSCLTCFAGTGIRRACVLVSSQKTLPIAVTVLNGLAPQIGGAVGLAVIPCVVSHLVQIVMDSMLVSLWLKQDTGNAQPTQQLA